MEKQCRLCLKLLSRREDFTQIEAITIEMFDTLILKPSGSLEKGSIICNTCSEVIQKLFDFKCTCLYAEDVLFPLVKPGKILEIKEVYLRKYGANKIHDIPDVPKICRLCLELIDRAYPLQFQLNKNMGTVVKTLQTYLPELNLKAIKRPLVCKTCLETLKHFGSFIGEYLKLLANSADPQIEVEGKKHLENRTADETFKENNVGKCETASDTTIVVSGLPKELEFEIADCESMRHKFKRRHHAVSYRCKRYRCRHCGYHTGQICVLKKHMLHHLEPSQVLMQKCGICDFKTKYKQILKTHVERHLEHKFDCDECKHSFKQASAYLRHKQMHQRVKSRLLQMYKCTSCDFTSKHKSALEYHQLNHKAETEVTMMICDSCGYTTRHKSQLKIHMAVHRTPDVSQMIECKKCEYMAKTKGYMRNHMKTHEDVSKSKVYKCGVCAYQTKYRYTLKSHALIHLSSADITMHECDLCTFQTKREATLKAHRKTHEKKRKLVELEVQ